METVQVRMVVSSKTSAEVSYLAKRLGLSKKVTYALIVDLFLYERGLDKAFTNLAMRCSVVENRADPSDPDDVPF